MLNLLLAQLVAPPLQQGPVRLPAQERQPLPREVSPAVPIELPAAAPTEAPPAETPGSAEPGAPPLFPAPRLEGTSPYPSSAIEAILKPCRQVADPGERVQACAAALTARLVLDGYINTRVYVRSTADGGELEIVEGRLVEVRVVSEDPWLQRRVQRLLAPLRGEVLRVPRIERELQLLQQLPVVGGVRASLSRLGSDPSQGTLAVTVERARQPLQGEFSLRNDGSNGSGEARLLGTLLKPSLFKDGDILLLNGEVNTTDEPEFGSAIGSLSYTLPLGEQFNVTGAFGYSRRNLVELEDPLDEFSTDQYQGLGQLEWVFHESLSQRWSFTLGYTASRGESLLDGDPLPQEVPETLREPRNGYLRLGLNGSGFGRRFGWSGTTYLLQGISPATPADQRRELAEIDIRPGQATAWGALVAASWALAPGWQLSASAGGQVAFQPLTDPMRFTLGSDVGLRGLPAQFVSGDSGWLGTLELGWTFWQNPHHALQLVPFIGAGGVYTTLPADTISDTVGSGGLLVRWQAASAWLVEVGWVDQFATQDNRGPWSDWALGQGFYGRVQYRF
ncbi:ShlB/FhaC/HecB family hemolysin secretion/activation protein [Aphanothece stagnina]